MSGVRRREASTGEAPRGRCRRSCAAVFAWLAVAASAHAVDLQGALRVFWTSTESAGSSTELTEQQYSLSLTQSITPYLFVRLTDDYSEYDTSVDGADGLRRTSQQPRVELIYSRPRLSGRVSWAERNTDGTFETDRLTVRDLDGSLSWRATDSLRLSAGYRDSENRADVVSLGRDTASRALRAEAVLQREYWGAGLRWSANEIENPQTGLRFEQERQEARLYGARGFFGDRLQLGFNGTAGRSHRSETVGTGEFSEPLPAIRGLYSVDLSPDLGDTETVPGLIDGDLDAPTSPPIEIGGGNTFRNIGLELDLTRPVARLEIFVDRPSAADVVWDVYRSVDNVFWERLGGVTREYDPALLRYTLRFPEVEARFVKAVNLTVNAEPSVRVTEIRALRLRVDPEAQPDSDTDLYRVDATAMWQVARWLRASAGYGTSNDQTSVAEIVRRDTTATYGRGGIEIDLRRDLIFSVEYRFSDYDEGGANRLQRTTDEYVAGLRWSPLPTVDALVSATTREETEDGARIQYSETARAIVSLRLFPDLLMVSQLSASRLDDPLTGLDRQVVEWNQRFETRPLERWLLTGGYTLSRIDTVGGERLLDRRSVYVNTDWSPGSMLTLSGDWTYYQDGDGDSLRQGYAVTMSPGPKLSLSLGWEEFYDISGRDTSNGSFVMSYRVGPRILFSATGARSQTTLDGGETETVSSARFGTAISF